MFPKGLVPLACDKTYNLGDIFVTPTNFKNRSVVRNETGESPIMMGPVLLHSKSKFTSFHPFFSGLCLSLHHTLIFCLNLIILYKIISQAATSLHGVWLLK